MNRKTLISAVALACAVWTLPTQARAESDAQFLARLMIEQQFEQTLDGLRQQLPAMHEQLVSSVLSDAPQEVLQKLAPLQSQMMDRYLQDLRQPAVRDELQKITIDALNKVLSPEELGSLASYYRTPLGAAVMAKQAKLSVEMMPAVMEISSRVMQPAMKEFMAEVEKLAREERAASRKGGAKQGK